MMDDFDEGWMYRSKHSQKLMDFTDDAANISAEVLEDLYLAARRGILRSYTMAPSKIGILFQRDLDHNLIPIRTAVRNAFNDEERQIVILLLRVLDAPSKYNDIMREAIVIIFKFIFDNSSQSKLKVIIKALVDNGLIDDLSIISAVKEEFKQKINDFFSLEHSYNKLKQHSSEFINFSYESPSSPLEKIMAKMVIKDTLTYAISNIIALNIINDLTKASVLGKSIGRVFLFGSVYGTIERMSMASNELRRKHPFLHAKLRELNLDMLYYFIQSYTDPMLDLITLSDDKFVLDNIYSNLNNALKGGGK